MTRSDQMTPSAGGTPALSGRDQAVATLLEACRERYPAPGFAVESDERATVWIRQQGGSRSVGLAPWLLREHSLEEVLRRADAKLGITHH